MHFEIGKKAVCIADCEMKHKMFTITDIMQCKCGAVELEFKELPCEKGLSGTHCGFCDYLFSKDKRFNDARFFRPVDETFAEETLAKITREVMQKQLEFMQFLTRPISNGSLKNIGIIRIQFQFKYDSKS